MCMAMHDRANLKPKGDAVRVTQFTQAIEELAKAESEILDEDTAGDLRETQARVLALESRVDAIEQRRAE